MESIRNRLNEILKAVFLTASAIMVLTFPSQAARGISDGIELCLDRVIPSIFPMMIICLLVVECGYARKIGRWMEPVSRWLFALPGEGITAVLLSMTGGYPAGAKAVVELYRQGAVTGEQAARMALFCFCAGPAFLVGVVGGLAGSSAAGWLLMAIQLVVVTVLGVIVCRIKKIPQMGKAVIKDCEEPEQADMASAIVSSVGKAASAMLQVCLYVIIFSGVNSLLDAAGISRTVIGVLTEMGVHSRTAEAVIPVLLEVTGGCVGAAGAGLPMMAFAVGFGGISVQMQVLAITGRLKVNRQIFVLMRVLQGILSAALTAIVVELLPDDTVVEASAQLSSARLSGSPQGAVMLLVMCAMCVLCLPRRHVCPKGKSGRIAGT